jgi:hypothetical protein
MIALRLLLNRLVGRPAGLKAIDSNFGRHMQIPTGIGPERFDVAVVAFGFAAEQVVSTRLWRSAMRLGCALLAMGPRIRVAASPPGIRPAWLSVAAAAVQSLVSLSRPAVHKFRLVSRGSHRGPGW